MEDGELLSACLSLLWRLPPQDTSDNTTFLCKLFTITPQYVIHLPGQLFPEKAEQILRRVQRPSILIFDSIAANFFLAGDWNKVVESYRSPWTADTWFKRDGSLSSDEDVPLQDRSQ